MQQESIILAIDTALGGCSVAISRGNEIICELADEKSGQQSKVLVLMIEDALAKAGLAYENVDYFASTIGPGGFTGIRVGLTAAKTLSLVTGKQLIGVSTLETIAYGAGLQCDVLATIDAYRGQYYLQRFRSNGALLAQSGALLVDAGKIDALGHGAKVIASLPHARDVAGLAYSKLLAGEREFPTNALYIREPDAKKMSIEKIL